MNCWPMASLWNEINWPEEKKPRSSFLLCVLIAAGLSAILFWPALTTANLVVFCNDSSYGKYAATFRQWPMVSLWNGLNWLGLPEPGNVPNVTGLLMLLLPLKVFCKVYAPLSVTITAALVWCGLRLRGSSQFASLVGAILAAFNPVMFAVVCWGLCTHAIAFGFAVLSIGFLSSQVPRRAFYSGVALGLCVTQSWDIGALHAVVIGCFALRKCKVLEVVLLVGTSFLVAFPSLYSVLSTTAVSVGNPLTLEESAMFSIKPEQVLGMFLPFAEPYNVVGSVNMGLATLVLCACARKGWQWVALALAAVLLSLGTVTPLYELFYSLPMASLMRAPAKFLHVLQFAALLVAVRGVEHFKWKWLLVVLCAAQVVYCARWVKFEDITRYDNPPEGIKFLASKKERVAFLPVGTNVDNAGQQYYDWLQKDFQFHGIPAYEMIQERQVSQDKMDFERRHPDLMSRYQAAGVRYLIDGNLTLRELAPKPPVETRTPKRQPLWPLAVPLVALLGPSRRWWR